MNDTDTPPPAPSAAVHWPVLDGLRGLAVTAVVAYHLGHLQGGFLGVDLFFVLSGFLITTLLLRERARDGRIALGRFWERRARRLLPALGVTLVAVVLLGRLLLEPSRLHDLRLDALSAAFYVANWHFALAPVGGYFAADPSPLRHTWSLSIEEQLYLVWPIVVVGVALVAGRVGRRIAPVVGGVAALGAAASAAWMAAHVGVWSTDRLYLGTDTRLVAPLAGAALATILLRRGARPPEPGTRGARLATAALVVGGVGLLVACVVADGAATWMYRGGFVVAALLGSLAVGGGALTTSPIALTALGTGPLRWLGQRSYGIYLYSWPIQIFALDQGVTGAPLTVLTVGLTLALATLSHRFLEMPVRDRRWPRVPSGRARPAVLQAAGATVVVLAVVVAATATDAEADPLAAKSQEDFEAEATRPAAAPSAAVTGEPRVLIVGDSVGYTLGLGVPEDLSGIAAVESRALPGCGLIVSGPRPAEAVEAGAPETYDGCAEPVAEADRLGLEGRPDVVLLVTGAWETSPHERDGRIVGPGDDEWADEVRQLLAERIERLSASGAIVALWADPCARSAEDREAQEWYRTEVLEPAAEASVAAEVVDPSSAVCEDGRARTDVTEVGDPRPEDGQHWSTEGTAWLWRIWAAPTLRLLYQEDFDATSVRALVVGDSIGFTLDFYGRDGAVRAGIDVVPGPAAVGCGLIREGRTYTGDRDLAETCGPITEAESVDLLTSRPDVVMAAWGAWEMAGVRDIPGTGTGLPGDPGYDAYVRERLRERLTFLGSTGATVALLGIDCWPPISDERATERVRWWQDLSREVTAELGVAYLDPTDLLCEDGEQITDIPGVGDPRPKDGAHWVTAGANWFWLEWLGPELAAVAAGER